MKRTGVDRILGKETTQMIYESLEVVELGNAELTIEVDLPNGPEEFVDKSFLAVAPYVEFDE
jgi:hypothetical protein